MATLKTDVEPERSTSDSKQQSFLRRFNARDFGILIALAVMVTFFSILQPDQFFTLTNLRNVLVTAAEPLTMAVGMTFLLIAGQLDLSIGSILVLSSVVGAKVMVAVGGDATTGKTHDVAVALLLGVLAALAAGIVAGLINGLLVTKLRLNALIVTLGMFGAALGLAQVVSHGFNVIGIPQQLQSNFGVKQILGFPLPVWISLLLVLIGGIWLRYTAFGRRTYATGSNPAGARRSGIAVDKHIVLLFVLMGALAAVAGLIDLGRFSTTSIAGHNIDNLTVISAVVIGGTSLSGGRGTMLGTLGGTLIPVVLQVGLLVMGIDPFWQTFAIGLVLIVAVAMDTSQRRQEARKFT